MEEVTKRDYLTALPPELLHEIISYLFSTHNPDKALNGGRKGNLIVEAAKFPRTSGYQHALDYLAATCKTLQAEVMEFAQTFLRQHKTIIKYKPTAARARTTQPRSKWLRGRGGLLSWVDRNCIFCGKSTARTAILMNGFHCCKTCDELQWPDKITKSAAREEYHLTDHHLLPHQQLTPVSVKMLARHPGGLPTLRYGTCMTAGCPTTFFLRKDVVALARLAHGDMEAHLAKRKVEREERRRKLRATEAAKYEQESRRLAREFARESRGARVALEEEAEASLVAHGSAAQPILLADDGDAADASEMDYLPVFTDGDYTDEFREAVGTINEVLWDFGI